VREYGGDGEAAGALDVHEEASGSGDECLEFVPAGLGHGGWVEKVNCENHLGGIVKLMWLLRMIGAPRRG